MPSFSDPHTKAAFLLPGQRRPSARRRWFGYQKLPKNPLFLALLTLAAGFAVCALLWAITFAAFAFDP